MLNKRAKAQLKKIGRRKKTGGFARIAKKATKRYGSKKAGQKVAGKIFQNMVRKHNK